jgi:hypothetical protein
MPYGYGKSKSKSSKSYGPPGSSSRRSAPTHQPRSTPAPVTTAVAPPSILSRPAPTYQNVHQTGAVTQTPGRLPPVTTGGPPSVLNPPTTPVTTAVAPPSILSRGPSPGISHIFLRNERIRENLIKRKLENEKIRANLIKRKKIPGYWDFAQSLVNPWETEEWAGDQDPNTTLGTRGIMRGLKDYMFGKGITSLQNLPESAKVWMAHSPKPDDFAKIAKEGFTDIRPTSRWSNLLSPRSYEQLLKGKNPLTSTGVYTAVGRTEKEALEAAAKFGKGPLYRGVGSGVDASKVFTAQVPRSTFPIHSGVLRTPQMEVPSSFANKYFGIGDKGLKVGAAPAKHLIKSTVGRLLPGANIALGGASALKHLQAGNYGQAAMAGLSMAPGPVGWLGLAGELGLGAFQKWRQNQAQGGIMDLYRGGGFSG